MGTIMNPETEKKEPIPEENKSGENQTTGKVIAEKHITMMVFNPKE